ncbi:MlaD family protein [Elizabethkingia sp. JS20170427COW]|uniref:MlaD family protein n=1 Tax=Elizabethkingia sp. JS20170427COW TaxID=2583851 RepID=UPI00111035B0|nr:MlaD family protein [Elizabethkingia sp. JS20170427COW]QCX53218.1 MCE family protein [Elizabethkingia sp. JS20170427COW]
MKVSKEIKAGLIAVVSIIGFVVLFQFMKGKNLFTTDNIYYVKYDNVEGLNNSSPVSINGLKVGQVTGIIPQTSKDGRIYFVVKINVNNDFVFSKKSTAEIFEPGLMSGKEMRINIAYDKPIAKDGDTLQGSVKLSMMADLSTQVGPMKDQVSSVLAKLDSVATSTNKMLDDENRRQIKLLLSNLNNTVEAFRLTAEQTNSFIASNQGRLNDVLDNANKTMITANTAVGNYGKLAESIDAKQLNQTITKLSETSAELNKLISGIEAGKGSLGKLTKDEELYNNLNKSAASLNALMEDLKANPKRYINISVFGKSAK